MWIYDGLQLKSRLGRMERAFPCGYMALPCGTGSGKDITFEYGLKYAALLRGDVCVYQA